MENRSTPCLILRCGISDLLGKLRGAFVFIPIFRYRNERMDNKNLQRLQIGEERIKPSIHLVEA